MSDPYSHTKSIGSVPPNFLTFRRPCFALHWSVCPDWPCPVKIKDLLVCICMIQKCGSKLPNDLLTTCFHEIQKLNRISSQSYFLAEKTKPRDRLITFFHRDFHFFIFTLKIARLILHVFCTCSCSFNCYYVQL